MLWYGYGFLMWLYGIYRVFNDARYLFRVPKKLGRYIYFNSLSPNNIPTDNKTQTIINWYFQWKNRLGDIDTVCHNVMNTPDTKYSRTDLTYTVETPYLNGIQTIKYYFWFIYLSMHSLLVGLFNPYPAIMLNESLKLMRVKLAKKNQLARDYLFHVSSPYYRPLWTYEAESKGSRVLFYFYSTNCELFKTEKGYPIGHPWHLMNWPHYLVWDDYQVDFVKKFGHGSPVIEDVGVIWFSSGGKCVDIPLNSIAVFDVTPKRHNLHILLLGSDLDYYTPNIANQFLSDIQLVLSQNHFNMLHKIKRNNQSTDKRYSSKINHLIRELNYINFDPQVDALQVIQKTKACISMPFTSTAIIAKQEGRPSVYYDPVGIIQKDDRAAHDIPVLSGINELRRWVESLVAEDFR
jgi:polysaccharide biosynthesis PFTS motif protein